MRRAALLLVLALVVAGALSASAGAAEGPPTLKELESEIMCPICDTTLELSDSPAANQIRREIERGIAAGKSEPEIKADLVAQFGPAVLAAPPAEGFNLLAWALPLGGGLAAAVGLGWAARRWRAARADGGRAGNGQAPTVDRELDRRLDEELARFDA